jgi:hypothetical protein
MTATEDIYIQKSVIDGLMRLSVYTDTADDTYVRYMKLRRLIWILTKI